MSRHALAVDHSAPLCLCITGVPARIAGLPPHIRADFRALMRPFVVSGAAPALERDEVEFTVEPTGNADGPGWRVVAGGEELFRTGAYDRLLRRLEWLVVARTVERSPSWLVWHAASLARDGQAVALVGESGAGKSTLAVELALHGWRPLADDLTLIDSQTYTLAPFRRCFHIEQGDPASSEHGRSLRWPVAALSDYARPRRWAAAGAVPSWLVVVRRDTSQPTQMTPITRAEAAGALFGATIHNRMSSAAASVAASVAGAALGCWRLNNNDLRATLDLLTSTLLTTSPRDARIGAMSTAARHL